MTYCLTTELPEYPTESSVYYVTFGYSDQDGEALYRWEDAVSRRGTGSQ